MPICSICRKKKRLNKHKLCKDCDNKMNAEANKNTEEISTNLTIKPAENAVQNDESNGNTDQQWRDEILQGENRIGKI